MASVVGPINKEAQRDDEGHRDYTVVYLVETTDTLDGPETISGASGLPAIGSSYSVENDRDRWALCTPYMKVTPIRIKDAVKHWHVEVKFSTRPRKRCQDVTVDNPLREPDKISGSFTRGTIEISRDRFGKIIKTSTFEPIKVEFDQALPTVRIEQNRRQLELPVFSSLVNTVNGHNLWGLTKRKVKLSNASYERKFYGVCNRYYTRIFDFEIDFNGFDRSDVPNRCKKFIRGEWEDQSTNQDGSGPWRYVAEDKTDINKPQDYDRARDRNGNPTEDIVVTSTGIPWDGLTPQFLPTVQYYPESNFFLLGIPPSLA